MATTAQRRATRRYRERRRKGGLTRLEIQVPAADAQLIRKVASLLRDQADEAARLRRHLGFEDDANARNALDIFAMPEPARADAEAIWEDAMAKVRRDRADPRLNRARKTGV
jgi:hypothetical protein